MDLEQHTIAPEKAAAPEAESPERDADGFPIKTLEKLKCLGAQRVNDLYGVHYKVPMRSLYPDNPSISEAATVSFFPTEEAAQEAVFRDFKSLEALVKEQETSHKM